MIIRPQRYFTVVRQIANHLDTNTYYVRAVIRDAFTDEILSTLNLDGKGGQRFSKAWLAAPDPSGEGREISIVTSVYVDSGYSTKSENYGDEENSHVIEARQLGGHGSGGGSLGSSDFRRIIREELESMEKPEPVKVPKPKKVEMRWDDVLGAIESIPSRVETKETDLSEIRNDMEEIKRMIVDKEVTPPVDLSLVVDAIREFMVREREDSDESESSLVSVMKMIQVSLVKEVGETIERALRSVQWTSTFTTSAEKGEVPDAKIEEEPEGKEEERPVDISRLTGRQ